ncbi:hypothetical protein ACLOJK_032870 [Asimina triloba]
MDDIMVVAQKDLEDQAALVVVGDRMGLGAGGLEVPEVPEAAAGVVDRMGLEVPEAEAEAAAAGVVDRMGLEVVDVCGGAKLKAGSEEMDRRSRCVGLGSKWIETLLK